MNLAMGAGAFVQSCPVLYKPRFESRPGWYYPKIIPKYGQQSGVYFDQLLNTQQWSPHKTGQYFKGNELKYAYFHLTFLYFCTFLSFFAWKTLKKQPEFGVRNTQILVKIYNTSLV